jgi:hypothetical protein
MKRALLIQFFAMSLAACGRNQPCPSCDDGADDTPPLDLAEEIPDLPCGGADLQNDNWNCGTCGQICWPRGDGEHEAGGCVAGKCSPTWHGDQWWDPIPLTCDDVCGTLSCYANGCAGLTGFVCESSFGEPCSVIGGGGGPLLLDFSGTCEEAIPWPDLIHGGVRLVYCCCG